MSSLSLLLSDQIRLRVISEALELFVEGGRVNDSWCMCVVSHGYGRLVGLRMEVVDSIRLGKSHGVGRMSEDAGALPKCQMIR